MAYVEQISRRDIGDEEITDVSLATFYVFDNETGATTKSDRKLVPGGGCGCSHGCGSRAKVS